MIEDIDITDKDPGRWNPTPKEFAAYKKREVELAKINAANFAKRTQYTQQLKWGDTLHSLDTWTKAFPPNP